MGFAVNSACHATAVPAFQAWRSQYPKQVGSDFYGIEPSSSVDAYGTITYTLRNATTGQLTSGTLTLEPCNVSESLAQIPFNSLWLVAVLMFAFFVGFKTSFRP